MRSLLAFHRQRCTPGALRAASSIPPTASDAAFRFEPLLPARPRSSGLLQVRPPASDEARRQAACKAFLPDIGSAASLALFERLQAPHRQLRTQRADSERCFPLRHEAWLASESGRLLQMTLADEAKVAAESLLGSVDAQRFLEQLRAPRLMEEMTRTPQNGTIPRLKPCDELSRAAAPASDASEMSHNQMHPASRRTRCTLDTLRAASSIPSTASDDAFRF